MISAIPINYLETNRMRITIPNEFPYTLKQIGEESERHWQGNENYTVLRN